MKNVAIIGAGNTGRILACDLALKGARVSLFTRCPQKAEALTSLGLEADGKLRGRVRLHRVSTDMAEVVRDAEAIFVMTTAAGHRPVAELLAPVVRPGQAVVIFNANWGALETHTVFTDKGITGVPVAETGTQLYIGQAMDADRVFVKQIKSRATLAAIEPGLAPELVRRLVPLIPQLVPAVSVLETSLSSANAIIHTPVCLFNLARIENGDDFAFYGEGASPSTVAFIEAVDHERLALLQALGVAGQSMLDILNSFWPDKHPTLFEAITRNTSYQAVKGPRTLDHRFLTEDLPFGIVPLAHLARSLRVPVPMLEAMLTAFSGFLGRDLMAEGFRPDLEDVLRLRAS